MAATRKRVSRTRGTGVDDKVKALFAVGCGWQEYGDAEVQRLWNEHGRDYLRLNHDPTCFALQMLGEPED